MKKTLMIASIVDLRYKMKSVLQALERNEVVKIFYRGKEKALLSPISKLSDQKDIRKLPAFGLWKDRKDLNVEEYIRNLRKPRFDDL